MSKKTEPQEQKQWTMEEIAEANTKAGRVYFSENTMNGWGQKLDDFTVIHSGKRVFVWAPNPAGVDEDSISFAEFDPKTGYMTSARVRDGKQFVGVYHRGEKDEFLAGIER
jgi:hypothetical protein